jgi:hypothetical protein
LKFRMALKATSKSFLRLSLKNTFVIFSITQQHEEDVNGHSM